MEYIKFMMFEGYSFWFLHLLEMVHFAIVVLWGRADLDVLWTICHYLVMFHSVITNFMVMAIQSYPSVVYC